jgi:hypothetical protein
MAVNGLDRVPGEPLPGKVQRLEPLTVILLSFATEDKVETMLKRKIQPMSQKELSNRCEIMADRLKVWTAGLLEVQGSETAHVEVSGIFIPEPDAKIQYLHKTVRDFLEQREEWDKIKAKTSESSFEPYTALLSAFTFELKVIDPVIYDSRNSLFLRAISLLHFALHAASSI